MAADGGAGSSGRRYQATVEIAWANEKYPLECVKDSCGRVSVALKKLRNIVCRSRAIPQATQLGAQQLCIGPLFDGHDSRGKITFGTQHNKTMTTVDKALLVVGIHAHKCMRVPEDLLDLMRELGSIPAKLIKAARGMASQTAGES